MNHKNSKRISLFIGAILLSFTASIFAMEDDKASAKSINIPMIENAQVFADFTDELPAVLNYFTNATEEQIIDLYQQHYDGFLSQERKRGRLTLTYEKGQHDMRVVISQQNKKRQVDVIVELKEK